MYLESFVLPIDAEEGILRKRAGMNAAKFGYVDNPYPCFIFPGKRLSEIWFRKITIFYGGNGSGKSTLLNLIAEKLELKRISPFNTGETFELYKNACKYTLGEDDEGDKYVVSGMLLYAKTDEQIQPDHVYHMSGNKISVRTLDLNCEFSRLAWQLDNIVEESFG